MKPRPYGSFARAIDRVRKGMGDIECAAAVGRTPALIKKWCDPDHDSLPNLRQALALDLSYVRSGLGDPRILNAYIGQLDGALEVEPAVPVDPLVAVLTMLSTVSELAQAIATTDGSRTNGESIAADRRRQILAMIERLDVQAKGLERTIRHVHG